MHSRLAKLTGLIAGTSLILTPLAVAGPAHAAPGGGTVTVNVVDEAGQPVKAAVSLIDTESDPFPFDPTPEGQLTYTAEVPDGDYAVVALGGWAGLNCAGTTNCELGMSGPTDMPRFQTAVVRAQHGTPATYTLTVKTPKLLGTASVGETLTIDAPDALGGGLGGMMGGLGALYGAGAEPGVTWLRDGQRIPRETATDYTLTGADSGSVITARVTYPMLYRMLFTSYFSGLDLSPAPVALGPVTVAKNASITSLRVVGKPRVRKPTTVWVNVSGNADRLAGWVNIHAKGTPAVRVRLRDGFAQAKLGLRAGKRTVTATFLGNDELNASSDAKTVRVQKVKKPKKAKGKKR